MEGRKISRVSNIIIKKSKVERLNTQQICELLKGTSHQDSKHNKHTKLKRKEDTVKETHKYHQLSFVKEENPIQ